MVDVAAERGPALSIIIPVLNEAASVESTLNCVQSMRALGDEVIVVDGGSTDDTMALARPLADLVITSEPGRAQQMNAGVQASHGEVLWFLHADTLVGSDARQSIILALGNNSHDWGRFDIHLSGEAFLLRMVERLMNLRSRITGIATGDQGIFVRHECFIQVGGFARIPLMEDIELSRKLKRQAGRPACLRTKIITSSRRWETHGILRTIILMWRLRLAYALGVNPAHLARQYR